MAIQPEVTAGGPRQRLLVVALAAVLVALLALLVVRPLLAGGTAPVAAPVTTAAGAPATTAPGGQILAPSTTVDPSARPVGAAKDPFRPAAGAAGAGGAGAAATPAGAGTPSDGGGAVGGTATSLPATQSTVPGSGGGSATAPGGGSTAERRVTLHDVFSRSGTRYARVSVDGSISTVREGQRFAGDYRAVDIGTTCATFESGTTPFTLCEGEAVLK
jgi:hypothetical protein